MTPDQIAALTEACILITQPLTEELMRDICRRVAEAGQISSTAQYQVLLAKSLGLADGAIVDALHKQEVLTERAIDDLMEYAAKNTVLFEDDGGLQKTIKAYSEMAKKEATYQLGNLAATTVGGKVYPLRDAYRKAMDYAFRQSITGALTPTQAVRRATRELASRGIRTIEQANGRSISLENAVRRTILNQMGQLVEKVSEQNHDELECDGWEISAHSGSAPDHEPYQGRQYPDKKYEALNSHLQRRIGTLSCKHLAFPIVIGVNSPQYTEEQLQQMAQENAQGITYEGRHYTQYEASQMQRDIENNIRMLKNRVLADKENKDSSQLQIDQIRLNVLNEQYNRFSSAAGLRTAPERLLIGGFTSSGKVKSSPPILQQLTYMDDVPKVQQLAIEKELALLPQNIREKAEKQISGIRMLGKDSELMGGYDTRTREILLQEMRSEGTVIHEYAHALERELDLYNDPQFLAVRSKGLENLTTSDIIVDTETFADTVFRIQHADKLISDYQGRLYENFGEHGIYDGVHIYLDGMREYFSEGLRVFYSNAQMLKERDPDLYRYIEELVK